MIILNFFIIFQFLIHVYNCKSHYGVKIVEGNKSNIKKHPYLVSIIQRNGNTDKLKCLCGGTIVKKRWILTAAHCIYEDSENNNAYTTNKIEILVGSSKCSNDGKIIKINKIVEHPQFRIAVEDGYLKVHNDIALIYLSENLKYGSNIKPVKLLTPLFLNNRLPVEVVGHECVAMGWGLLEEGVRDYSVDLYDVMLPLLRPELCTDIFKLHLIHINATLSLCTMDPEGHKDVCTGDSGGPLMCSNYQAGIASGGIGCARKNLPTLWTRVDMYYNWINDITNSQMKSKISSNNAHNISANILYILVTFTFIYS